MGKMTVQDQLRVAQRRYGNVAFLQELSQSFGAVVLQLVDIVHGRSLKVSDSCGGKFDGFGAKIYCRDNSGHFADSNGLANTILFRNPTCTLGRGVDENAEERLLSMQQTR